MSSPRTLSSSPRRHRIARACIFAVGTVLVVIGIGTLVTVLAQGQTFLVVFRVDASMSVLWLVSGAALVVASLVPTFVWGRLLSISLGLFFGFLGLAGGVSGDPILGVFRATTMDNTFNVLLCTVLLGVGALSLDRLNQLAD